MNRTGAEMIIEALKKEGVDTIFGYPGGAVIPIFDVTLSAYHGQSQNTITSSQKEPI